jgi:hypothetical protein
LEGVQHPRDQGFAGWVPRLRECSFPRRPLGANQIALLSLGFALVPLTDAAAVLLFSATLSGANEDPPVPSTGTGSALVTYDDLTHVLAVHVSFADLVGTTTVTHIHAPTAVAGAGNVGVATGAIVIALARPAPGEPVWGTAGLLSRGRELGRPRPKPPIWPAGRGRPFWPRRRRPLPGPRRTGPHRRRLEDAFAQVEAAEQRARFFERLAALAA